jgi:transcriptional regulator with XRE-family HTH domain
MLSKLPVGERVEMRRRQRGLSRKVVANLVGRSEEWLRLVESGKRKLDSVEVISRLAEVLRVDDPTELTEWPYLNSEPRDQVRLGGLESLWQAIVDHPAVAAYYDPTVVDKLDIGTVAADLAKNRTMWGSSPHRYSALLCTLPPVLWASRIQRWHSRSVESGVLLVRAYHLARQLLTGVGAHSLAVTVADRSLDIAAQTDTQLLVAASVWHVGNSLLQLGNASGCREFVLAAYRRLPDDASTSPDVIVVGGALLLLAARGATAMRDHVESARLLEQSVADADRLGADHHVDGITFGPIEVSITAVEIALAENDADKAIDIAARVDVGDGYPLERRTSYYICLAHAYAARSNDVAAVYALSKAAEICPEDLCHDSNAHRTLRSLIRRDNQLIRTEVSRLSRLAALS